MNVGHVKVIFDAPSAGITNRHLGTVQFQQLPSNQWVSVSVPISPNVQAVLAEAHHDAQLVLDIHAKTSEALYFDRLRLAGMIQARPATN